MRMYQARREGSRDSLSLGICVRGPLRVAVAVRAPFPETMMSFLPSPGACPVSNPYLRAKPCAIATGIVVLCCLALGDLKAGMPATIALRVPPVVAVEAGQQAFLAVHVQAEYLDEPVTLSFSGLPPGVAVGPASSGSANQVVWRGMVQATPGAVATSATVTVHARSGKVRADRSFELVVTRTRGAGAD